jgi:hypothetical protein
MPEGSMTLLHGSTTRVSVTELAEIIDTDPTTIDNWLRRKIITRAPLWGRKLTKRLFSAEEIYKTALKNELVKLGISPSSANDAVSALWKEWDKRERPEGRKVYAVVLPTNGNWTVALCSQKVSGGPLYKLEKSMRSKSIEEMDLPKRAFAVIPISDVFERVSSKLSELLGELKNYGAKGKP